jgi:predicted acyltransferase
VSSHQEGQTTASPMAHKGSTDITDRLTGQKRALALDALRGLSILAMALSGYIPYGVLPSWMYHAQVPPPQHIFNPQMPGLTWVDLVFPFFLFSMGAAMPLALSRRIEKGYPQWKTVLYILERGFLLAAFALYREHVLPGAMSENPRTQTWLLALFAFALLFPILVRLPPEGHVSPKRWNPQVRWAIKGGGWLGAIVFMALIRYPDGSGFSLNRSDIIIMLLANSAVFGSLIWLLSKANILMRLSFLGILMAQRFAAPLSGWVHSVSEFSPLPWVYRLGYLHYLFIVVPGTIVGDLILKWIRSPAEDRSGHGTWTVAHLFLIAVMTFGLNVILVVGLTNRWLLATTLVACALCALGWWLVSRPTNSTEQLIRSLFLWGAYWLVLGLVFEPYEGGIKKDPNTMSYFFVTSGLAIFLLIALTIIIDVFNKRRWLQMVIDNGQNPMIAYLGITNLIPPLLALTSLGSLLESLMPTPWLGALRGMLTTLLLALAVSVFTRRKIFWRT